MKKRIVFFIALALSISVYAQNEQDALRLSQIYHGGSARSIGIGGAVGALGSDFGALSVNPAASGIYRRGDFSITTGFQSIGTSSIYLNNNTSDNAYSMGIDQFGFVMPFLTKNSSEFGLKSISFSFGYNKLRDFTQNFVMEGVNNRNSLVDEFVYSANNNSQWDPFSDQLAYETYLIDYFVIDSINDEGYYFSDFDNSNYGQTQRRTVSTAGNLGEYVFNLGANISDKLYIGGSFGIQQYRYEETWNHFESDPSDRIDYFNSFEYKNQLEVRGTGYNAKIGILAQPVQWVRLGASVHTPTFFGLNDSFFSSMVTDLDFGVYDYSASNDYKYKITSPFRAVGSAAFLYKNRAMLSIDYEYVDYASARLSAGDYDFYSENQAVNNRFGTASNIRVGGEVVFGPLFVRGGYALYGSPYVSGEANENMDVSILSGGAGYRNNRMTFDFAVSQMGWDQKYYLYGDNSAELSSSSLRFTATLGIRF